jgi:UrcA family protein
MRLAALATLTAAAALVCGAPAFAQSLDELTVTGHLNGSRLQTLSDTVSYGDLDLTYAGDRERLRLRVNNTARRICDRLNQDSPNPANMGHSCQEVAVRGAMDQVRQVFADARTSAYADAYGEPTSATVYDDPR